MTSMVIIHIVHKNTQLHRKQLNVYVYIDESTCDVKAQTHKLIYIYIFTYTQFYDLLTPVLNKH